MKKKAAIVFLILTSLLMGCGEKVEKEATEITLMHGWGGTLPTHAIMQEIFDEFSRENQDINLVTYPSSHNSIAVEKANDMLSVGKMPDIISTNGLSYFVSNAVKRGMALDLIPFIEQDQELKNSIHPEVLAEWAQSGSLYTVPDALEISGYWYNKEFFKKAGIVDENGEADIPKDWEEFFIACEKLQAWGKKTNPEFRVAKLDGVQLTENFFLARAAGCGKEGMDLAQKMPKEFSSSTFYKTLNDIIKLGTYCGFVDNIENARQSFEEGNSAIYFNGVWESEPLSSSKISGDFEYAAYPTDGKKSLSYISPSSGYVFYRSGVRKKEEACVRFLKYMLSEKVQKKMVLETGQAPANPNVSGEVIQTGYPLLGRALESANKADIHIKVISSVWDSQAVEILSSNLPELAQGKITKETLINLLNQ